jgi:alpha-tubulin suppressor-like RCC1 family protein
MKQLIKLLFRRALAALAAIALLTLYLALYFDDAAAAGTPVTPLAWGSNSAGQLGYPNPRTNFFPHLVVGLGSGSGVVAIAAGGSHSLALKANGAVLAWGNNASGQLGDGTTTPRITAVQVSGLGPGSGVVSIAAGNTHSLALKSDGTVVGWGNNANGQLGDGTTIQRTVPVQASALGPGSGAVAIAAGDFHSLVRKSDGSVVAFGSNANGQLGDGTTTQRTVPVQVTGLGPGAEVISITAGTGYSLAAKSDGTTLAWGRNPNGQLGDGTTTQRNIPVQVTGLGSGSGVIAVSAGNGHTLALKSNGTLLGWGRNPTAQVGDGTTIQRNTPVQVVGLGPASGVVAVATGESHSLALKSNNTSVIAWGNNVNGQVGDGTTNLALTPVDVIDPSAPSGLLRGVVAISASGQSFHSLALKSDGTVLSWGNNANGQLGDGNIDAKLEPLAVAGIGGIIAIGGGQQYSLALRVDGTVLTWGANANSQLGDGTTNTRITPLPVLDPSSSSGFLSGIVAIAAGAAFGFGIRSDGAVLGWGGNPTGQLGDGTTTNRSTPVQVTGLGPGSGVVAIVTGNGFTLALKSDGTVLAWGNNADGRLGDGTTTQRNAPVQVTGLGSGSGVVTIAAGFSHSVAVKADGTVLAWGNNASGQLGDGTTTQRNTPVQVSGLGVGSGVVAVAGGSGGLHTLALKSDGTVLAWGNNATGQLGDGTTTSRTTPNQVTGLGPGSGVVAIAAGGSHSLALRADGTVLAWGSNANGQVGDGTLETRLIPVRVSNLGPGSGIASIAAGGSHSLAVPLLTTSSGFFYFAQAGGGGGFSTAIFLANPSPTTTVRGSVSFFSADGRPLEGLVDNAAQTFVLPPLGTITIRTRSQGKATAAYARVSSSDPVVALATYSLADFAPLSVGPSTAPAAAFRAPVGRDRSRGINVGVAAVNVSTQRVIAVFTLTDSNGRLIRSFRTARILEPGEQVSETLTDLFPNLPDNFEGTLTIVALAPLPTQALVVTVVRFSPGTFNDVPVTPLAKEQLRSEENVP